MAKTQLVETSEKTHVVFLARRYAPHLGGVEKHLEGLVQTLIKRGWNITIITEQHDISLSLHDITDHVEILRIPRGGGSEKKEIWSWIRAHSALFMQADIVHAHDVFWWLVPVLHVIPKRKRFITFHGYEDERGPNFKTTLVRQIWDGLAHKNLCVGGWIRKWYGTPADAITYGAASAKPRPLPAEHSMVFVGRLADDTHIADYISLCSRAEGMLTLDIYGDGPLREKIEHLVLNYPMVKYLGTTKHPEAALAKYRFVCASQYMTMLQAMQIGRLVLSLHNTELKKDYLEDFPAFEQTVHATTPEKLLTQLELVIAEPEREREMITRAQDWALEQTWEKLADTYEDLWQS